MGVEEIFSEAAKIESATERAAYLDKACKDGRLRDRVEALLAAHDNAASFLETAAGDLPAAKHPLDADATSAGSFHPNLPITEAPGTVVGRYKLLQQIGEGGMGVVYMAEQEKPVRRRVALKIIKPGMDSAQVIARFEAERQALALMILSATLRCTGFSCSAMNTEPKPPSPRSCRRYLRIIRHQKMN